MSMVEFTYPYQRIILQQLPKNKGWAILGVKDKDRLEKLAELTSVSGWHHADQLANLLARELAGRLRAELD